MADSAPLPPVRPKLKISTLRWPGSLTVPLVLFLIIACFYWKLVFTYQYDWVWGPDLAEQVLPWYEEESRQMQQGQFPLWDPHSWLGQSFLGQAQPGAAYPLNWLLWLIPKHDGHIRMWALQWYYVVIHFMAALFMYLLCRDLKRSRGASLVAALVFSLAGYVGWTDWPQMVNGAVWTPLVFLFLLRAARGEQQWASAALCGTALGMSWLSGHHQVPIFLMLAAGGTWLYYTLKDGRVDWRIARLAAAAMVFALMVGALQILPAQEYGKLAWRWVGAPDHVGWKDVVPYYVHAARGLHPMYLFLILIPTPADHASPFLGVVAVSLALLGIAVWWRQHAVKVFSAIAIGALVYSLGANSVMSGFIYAVVPFVEKARVPAMATLLFHAGFACLAAFGVDALGVAREALLTEPTASQSPWLRRMNLGIAGFAVLLGGSLLVIYLAKQYKWDMDSRVGVTFLCTTLMAVLLYAWRSGNLGQRQAVTLLTLLLLLEVGNLAEYMLSDRSDFGRRNFADKAWGNADIAEFLHAQPGPFRLETATEDIVGNWGDYYNLDFMRAQAGVTVNTFELEAHIPQTQKLLGVKYVLGRKPTANDQKVAFQGTSNVVVYENPAPFPRAWTVHEVVPIRFKGEGRMFIIKQVDELRNKVLMIGDAPKLACPGTTDQVSITKYEPARVDIDAQMNCDGMLVLSDNYYPGWHAEVDGRDTEIHEVDLALRGVFVPQGKHTVTFRYRPASFLLGLALTLTGWIGAAVITILSRKKARLAENHE